MSEKPEVSLKDFITERRKKPRNGRPCWTCTNPQAAIINESLREGAPAAFIAEWLRDQCGQTDATGSKIDNHKREGHHTRSGS